MDDVNDTQNTRQVINQSDSEHGVVSNGQFQTFTEVCSAMKDESLIEAQQIIVGKEKMGKAPTFTQACSAMKDRMAEEAQQIIAGRESADKSQTFGDACLELKDEIASESQRIFADPEPINKPQILATKDIKSDLIDKVTPQDPNDHESQKLEQAKQAIKEANWFAR
jgi:hypothetical protein